MIITVDERDRDGYPVRESYVQCDHDGCEERHKNHRWGNIKAEGWFHGKDGSAFCPEHVPEWYEDWRRRKAESKRAREK